MKGRTPTQAEKAWHDALASHVGCLPCFKESGRRNTWVSIHHMAGRTSSTAHLTVLPLCAGHHQNGYGPIPMPAVHGRLREFESRYGTEDELLALAVEQLLDMGFDVPEQVMELVGVQVDE